MSKKITIINALFLSLVASSVCSAANLNEVLFSKLPSNKVQINLSGDGDFPEPKIFSTKDPARVVFDFFGMKSKLDKPNFNIKSGAVDTLSVVNVADRTRVVMDLLDNAPYRVSRNANTFVINVDGPERLIIKDKAKPQPFSVKPKLDVSRRVKGVDFRRSEKGGGRIVVDLSDPSTIVGLKKIDGEVVVDFRKTTLDNSLEKRLDVTDFATTVRALDVFQNGDDVRIVIEPSGPFQQVSYQNDNIFTVILDPIEKKVEKKDDGSGYKGDKLSMNFQGVEVRSVLSVISDFTGLNIIASDDVTGDLTLNLKDVPWDQALDLILETKGLAKRQKGNVIWVAPAQRLAEFERLQLEAAQSSKALEPLVTEVIEINYAKADVIKGVILEERDNSDSNPGQQILFVQPGSADSSSNVSSDKDASLKITADERTNSLIITTTESNLIGIKALIAKLDSPIRQVMVETRIVLANDTFSKELGAKLGLQRVVENAVAGSSNVGNVASSGTLQGANNIQQSLLDGNESVFNASRLGAPNVDLGASGAADSAPASYAFSLFKAGTGYADIISLELSALEAEGSGKIVSSPRLVTSNQKAAEITTGQTRFITVGISPEGTPITVTRDALLKMLVTPQITPDDNVILDVNITQDTFLTIDSIRRNNIATQVSVENGETIIIGGIYQEAQFDNVTKVPLLGDLPVLGRLFKKRSRQDNRSELLIFLTPKIIDGELNLD